MGAKTSAEMLKARKLIEAGSTPADAARKTGITPHAIHVSKWYRERRQAQREAEQAIGKVLP